MPPRQGPSSRLLVLAVIGGLLLLYRLSTTRHRWPTPPKDVPLPSEPMGSDPWWTRKIVAVGDLHGGELIDDETTLCMWYGN